jgi:hypothetical protein
MPRRVRVRESDDGPEPPDDARREWVTKWKTRALAELSSLTARAVKIQLRIDVERALSRYRPDDDEGEIRDVVLGLVDEVNTRLATAAAEQLKALAKQVVIAGARLYLRAALAKFDRAAVAALLKRPGLSEAALTTRLQETLDRHLKGGEDDPQIQRFVDAWVARRLAEQPPVADGASGNRLGTTSAAVAAAGLLAYQHPAVKDAVNQSVAKAQQLIRKWRKPAPPENPKPS